MKKDSSSTSYALGVQRRQWAIHSLSPFLGVLWDCYAQLHNLNKSNYTLKKKTCFNTEVEALALQK